MLGLVVQNKHKYNKKSDVNFYDGYGRPIYTFTAQEALNLESMPEPPDLEIGEYGELPGWATLTKQWNWTLEEMKNAVQTMGYCEIGVTYGNGQPTTTIIAVAHAKDAQVRFFLWGINKNISSTASVSATVLIDWGDGTTSTWKMAARPEYYGQGSYVEHAYSDGKDMHTISITRDSNNINANIPYLEIKAWTDGMAPIAVLLSAGMGAETHPETGAGRPEFCGINKDASELNAFWLYADWEASNNRNLQGCTHIPRNIREINVDSKYKYDNNYVYFRGLVTMPPGLVFSGRLRTNPLANRVIYTGRTFKAETTAGAAYGIDAPYGFVFSEDIEEITGYDSSTGGVFEPSSPVYFFGRNPPTLKLRVFGQTWDGTIHCPEGTEDAYRAAAGYPQDATYIADL